MLFYASSLYSSRRSHGPMRLGVFFCDGEHHVLFRTS